MPDLLRGRCAVCGYSVRLRKNGAVQAHHLYIGAERQPDCDGGGKPPRPYAPNECGECMVFYYGTPGLIESIWSVAIESPKSGEQIALEFLRSYHLRGHKEDSLNDQR
jgi:hypothetical protein